MMPIASAMLPMPHLFYEEHFNVKICIILLLYLCHHLIMQVSEINNAGVPFIMNGLCSKKIHSEKIYKGSCKIILLNKAFITPNPPVTTLVFSGALHNATIPRPKCIYNKGTSSTYEWHSTFNILPATEINSSS